MINLITGANRGLGLEFTRQLLARGDRVFAACRQPDEAQELNQLAAQHSVSLTILKLDVTDQENIDAAAERVEQETGRLDLLVNNAGVNKSGNFGDLTAETIQYIFEINSFAPALVTQAFASLLAKGQSPKVVSLSSGLGSIEENQGSHHVYSASKAALNMFVKSLSYPLRREGITHIAMDPGWVQTDMGGSQAPLKPEESISGILDVIDNLSLDDAGRYMRYDGAELPW